MTEFLQFTYAPAITPLLVATFINAALAAYAFRHRDVHQATMFAWLSGVGFVTIAIWAVVRGRKIPR